MLKAYFDPEKVVVEMMYVSLVRKFVLPGTIFFAFLLRYADIENTLVPLNRIVEPDYNQATQGCPWLSQIRVLNERILAFDARHRDVVGATQMELGKAPTIDDIVQNMIDHYDHATIRWQRRMHRDWGLFRSMWPASVLLDGRMDRADADTRAWLTVFVILSSGCALVSIFSLYLLFFKMLWMPVGGTLESALILADAVLTFHGMIIIIFIYRTIMNMFYFYIQVKKEKVLRRTMSTAFSWQGSRPESRPESPLHPESRPDTPQTPLPTH